MPWGERELRQALEGLVAPDGFGVLQLGGSRPAAFLLELDRGTEEHERLRQKATRYAKALPRSEFADDEPTVVFAAPTPGRRAQIERALAEASVPIAAVVWTPERSALDSLRDALQLPAPASVPTGPPPAPHA